MSEPSLRLSLVPGQFAVCRLDSRAEVPAWAGRGAFFSITRTDDELSIVCREDEVPPGIVREPGWACLRVEGTLDFALVGVLASLTAPLARAGVSLFALSTYDTDYLLVKATDLDRAVQALAQAEYPVGRT